jgi:PAS domain S-box-containing protein
MSKVEVSRIERGPSPVSPDAASLLDFPLILGEVTDGVTIQDPTGKLIFANEAAARLSGYASAEEMLATPLSEFARRFALFDEAGAVYPFNRLPGRAALQGEAGSEVTLRFRDRKLGVERWSMVRALPILAPDGAVRAAINIFKDVTAEKQAEQALRESETRFHLMADTAPVLIWTSGLDARYNFFNRPWLEYTGRSMEQELGDGWLEGVHPDDRQRYLQTYLGAFETREPFRTEYRLRGAGGQHRWMLDNGVPRFDPDGRFAGYIGSCIDITERKRTETGLRFLLDASLLLAESMDLEARLTSLAHLVVPGLADWCAVDLVGEDGALERVVVAHQNPAKVHWAYQLQREFPPRPDAEVGVPRVIRTGETELHAVITDEMLRGAARNERHLELLRSLGIRSAMLVPLRSRRRTLGAISFVAAESGRTYDSVDLALAEDLARRAATAIENARLFREAQEARQALEAQRAELEKLAAELEASNEELIQRTSEAEQANRAKANFLAVMSHELRTPLNAIAGYVDLLQMGLHGPLSPEQEQDLKRIQASQEHLLGIINQVLSFARLESGRVEVQLERVPVLQTLSSIFELLEPQLRAKQLDYACDGDNDGLCVHADPERLRQILLNLLGNAIKFTPAGGRIGVSCRVDTGEVTVRIADSGRGIPTDRLQTVFEPFVQVDPALTRESSGVGLGLAISRELARAMGGDLFVESTVGEGSTFMLTLPQHREDVSSSAS